MSSLMNCIFITHFHPQGLNAQRGGASEKLLNIKTVRFYGKGLFGCESYRFTSKKLLNDKIFIFWRSGVI